MSWKNLMCEKMKVLLCNDLVTYSQGQGYWKWYEMVERNCGYKHGRYAKNWLKSVHVISNAKVFAMQDGQLSDHLARWPWLTTSDQHDWLHQMNMTSYIR